MQISNNLKVYKWRLLLKWLHETIVFTVIFVSIKKYNNLVSDASVINITFTTMIFLHAMFSDTYKNITVNSTVEIFNVHFLETISIVIIKCQCN